MKYLNIFIIIVIILVMNMQETNAMIPTNIKADSLLIQMPVSYPFSFIVMGDSQPYGGQLLNDIFIETLSQVAELTIPITFVIICGDLTESGNEEGYIAYSEFISDWMETTGIPFYSLPGNHDFYDTNSFDNYSRYIDPRLDYYFDYGNSRFIALNNVRDPEINSYHITEAQLDSVDTWLSSGLVNHFAFNHASIVRDDHGGGFGNEGYEALHNLLVEYDAVADFNGHHRDYYRNDIDETFYLTTAGAGGALAGNFYPPLSYNNHHWLYVTVNELNDVFMEMYFLDEGHNNIASLYDFQLQLRQNPPSIFINEFMASNQVTFADPQGDFDDWIEIYNAENFPVNIGGMYITDELADPAKWKIPDTQPDSTTIQPGEFLLLWADEDIDDGILHLNIKLAVEGEEIGLYTDDLTSIIDSITFDEQIADESFGRDPDGFDNWVLMDNPTPGYSNNYIPIEADLYADTLTGFAPLQVSFTDISTGSIINWEWDFDNDSLIDSYDQNPIYEYTDEGVYTVSLTVSDGITTDTETKTDYIEVLIPIIGDFTADPLSGLTPMEVTFTSSSTGNIISWEWDFDNDGLIDSNDQNPIYEYADEGVYTVSLTVSDGITTDTETKTDYIEVLIPLIADFTADPLSGLSPMEVTFTSSSTGNITSWEWDFDNDGNIDSIDENPTNIYSEVGLYSVKLTISDEINTDSEVKPDYVEVTSTTIDNILPSNITKLYKNHPNPFNPITSIKFSIKDNDTGLLTILNIKGQIIESQTFNSGLHNYFWNASNYSSGIYFYKLQTSSLNETKKMLLLK